MLPSFRRGALVAGSVLCLAVAGLAAAQPAPPTPDAGAPGHHHGDPAARQAKRAERMAEALQLRPEQQGALNAFLDAVKRPGGMHDHMRGDQDQGETLTTPQRLDKMLARMDEMHARLVTRVQATKTFYAQLSPEQQKAFDAMGGGFGRHDHGDRHGDGHGPGGPDGHGPDGPGGDPDGGQHG